MQKYNLVKKKQATELVDQQVKSMQTYIQECHLSFYNFFRQNGVISDFLLEKLSQQERQKIVEHWDFMHKGIIEQLRKGRNFKNYAIIVLYIKDYLNALFPVIKNERVEEFINYGFKLLAFQLDFFKQLQKTYQAKKVFVDFVHSLPTSDEGGEIKQSYTVRDSVLESILSVELAMMR